VVVFMGVRRAAHHPQHSDTAGADESRDQGGRDDQEDDIQPGER
jgi:hypothetical protein